MKSRFRIFSLSIVAALVIFSGYSRGAAGQNIYINTLNNLKTEQLEAQLIGAKAAKADSSLTLEEMLTYAIQDEYLAKAKYQLIVEKFGGQRPFSNIIRSEVTHIEHLKPLFTKYKASIPPDNVKEYLTAPKSLKEGFQSGVQGEIENIEMYERFLNQNIPDDVKAVFTRLRNASRSHLRAFEKGLQRM